MDYRSRQKKIQQTLDGHNLDGFVVTHPANLRYLCGYTGSNGLLLFLSNPSRARTARSGDPGSLNTASSSPMAVIPNRRARKSVARGWSFPKVRCSRTLPKSSAS
ncbi:MAG TPA: aminopeptidase P family N-terminal domain-containing protein [Terriglobales bacterium]|jgi:Xaa-Pro aminopeptidase